VLAINLETGPVSYTMPIKNMRLLSDMFLSKKYALIAYSIFILFSSLSCKKGQAFRFGDQDLFAFGAQDSCHFNRNNVGVRISWKGSMPVNMIIHSSVPAKYDVDILSAANRWNSAKGRTLITVTRDNSVSNAIGNDRKNMIFWSTDWDSSNLREQARTSTNTDLSRIMDADIKINAKSFNYSVTAQSLGSSAVNFESLILHEMGHVLGLQHFEGDGVMSPYLPAAKLRLNLSSDEISELSCEY
jgi:hypothetical protein